MNKILLIDNNTEFLYYMKYVCKRQEWCNFSFSNSAIKALKREDLMEFTHIIVDLHMERMNGDQFIKQYKKIGGKARLILCTSYITEEDGLLGADDGLRKPFTLEQFKEILGIS